MDSFPSLHLASHLKFTSVVFCLMIPSDWLHNQRPSKNDSLEYSVADPKVGINV